MKMRKIHGRARDLHRMLSMVLTVVMLTSLEACHRDIPTVTLGTPGTEHIEVGASGYDVKQDISQAWATLTSLTQYDALTDKWVSLSENGWVTTDAYGQAELCPGDQTGDYGECPAKETCHVYVFWNSSIQYSSCEEGSTSSTCLYDGTAVFIGCDISVGTPGAVADNAHSTYSVTYLRQSQVTIVILFQGRISVTPVTMLNMDATDLSSGASLNTPPWRDYEIYQRVMGETYDGGIDPGANYIQVYYTAPDGKLSELGLLDNPAGPRRWQGIEGLNAIRESLRLIEPNLEQWLLDIKNTVNFNGFDLQVTPLSPEKAGLVVTGYGMLADSRFAEALYYGMDWGMLRKYYAGEMAPIIINGANQFREEFNLLTGVGYWPYDPERGKALLAEAGYADTVITTIVVLRNGANITHDDLFEALNKMGIRSEVMMVDSAELPRLIRSYLEKEIPLLVFEVR